MIEDTHRSATIEERHLLLEIACYFSERAVEERGSDDKAAELYDRVAEIIAMWKPEK